MKDRAWKVGVGLALFAGFVVTTGGCSGSSSDPECSTSGDCAAGLVCDRGHCADPSGNNNNPNDAGNNNDNNEPACPEGQEPEPGDLVLNEVLADPPAEVGDANGDGVADTGQDEFLEFYNASGHTLNINGLKIFKNDTLKVETTSTCLEAKKAFVIFGGLADAATPPSIPETVVEIADKEMGLNNTGAAIRVETAGGVKLLDVEYPGASDQSVTLTPQVIGTEYVEHRTLADAAYSPGTCPDGQALATGCPGVGPECDAAPAALGDLVINEILSRVPMDEAGDANGDGVRSSSADEFVEIVNIAARRVRVADFTIYKDDTKKNTLATECLDPGQGLVVFGGLEDGAQPPVFGSTVVEIGSSFGFTDGGVSVSLYDATGSLMDSADLGASDQESFTRQNQLTPGSEFVGHTTLRAGVLFSPGTCPNGSAFADGCPSDPGGDVGGDVGGDTDEADAGDVPIDPCDEAPMATAATLILNEILTDVAADLPGDANGDGTRSASADEFVELWNSSGALLRVEGVEIRNNDTRKVTLSGCLEANTGLVVFGGIEDGASLPTYPDMAVRVADSSFTFSNTGGTVTIVDPAGVALVTYEYPAGHDASFVRNPELDNASPWEEHNTDPTIALFSPGTCRGGGSLATGCQ